MNDYIIMDGLSRRFTDLEITDIETLFGSDPAIAIIVDGTAKDRRRADRRKATAHKHQRLEKIASRYPSKDSDKYNLKKRCRESKAWYAYDDLRKDTEADELAEAWKVATYLEQRQQFFKAVDQWEHDEEEVFVYTSTPSYKVHIKLSDCREYDFDTLDEALDFVEHCAYDYSISRRNYDYPLYDVNEDGDCITYQGKEYYIDGCWYGFYLDNLGAHYYL